MQNCLKISISLLTLWLVVLSGLYPVSFGQSPSFNRAATLTLNQGEAYPMSASIDTAGGFAYFGTGCRAVVAYYPPWAPPSSTCAEPIGATAVKVRLSDFSEVGSIALNTSGYGVTVSVIDPSSGFVYFGVACLISGCTGPARIVKVRLSDFAPVGTLSLNSTEKDLVSAAIDSSGFAYFGTYSTPSGMFTSVLVKVRLSDLTQVGSINLNTYNPDSILIDSNGFGYVASDTSPVTVVKFRLSDLVTVANMTIGYGQNSGTLPSVIDPIGGFAYYPTEPLTSDQPGTIVKVRLSNLTIAGALTLNSGENTFGTSVIDPVNGLAYFTVSLSCCSATPLPGEIVKVKLSDLTRVDTLTLDTGENSIASVIDSSAGFAYFGTYTNPGKVVMVKIAGSPISQPNPLITYVLIGVVAAGIISASIVLATRLRHRRRTILKAPPENFGL